ncbi:respiratory nitrate reductase subunit gamma [Streptomyces sp. NPDC001492]
MRLRPGAARRLLTRRIRLGTDRSDKLLFPLLSATVLLGHLLHRRAQRLRRQHDYRQTVSVWFRGIFALQPHPAAIADAPLLLQLHALTACLLFAGWPFPASSTCGASRWATSSGRTWSTDGAQRPRHRSWAATRRARRLPDARREHGPSSQVSGPLPSIDIARHCAGIVGAFRDEQPGRRAIRP